MIPMYDNHNHTPWWDGLKILVGTALTSFAFRFLTFPNHIVSGGVTGLAQIVNLLTGFPVGVAVIEAISPGFCCAATAVTASPVFHALYPTAFFARMLY